jgi:hypothetical protein
MEMRVSTFRVVHLEASEAEICEAVRYVIGYVVVGLRTVVKCMVMVSGGFVLLEG